MRKGLLLAAACLCLLLTAEAQAPMKKVLRFFQAWTPKAVGSDA
jgi:hypothetical protein